MTAVLPAVVLVRPQLAENVGGAARVLHNFGFSDLRLVQPRSDFSSDQKAIACACAGDGLLRNAKSYVCLESAVSDMDYLYAATARMRFSTRGCISSRHLSIKTAKTGILFGPENSGLANADLNLCDELVYIDAVSNPLNLVHAIAIIAYQCHNPTVEPTSLLCEFASKKELAFLYDTLSMALEKSGFFRIAEKKVGVMQNVAAMFSRANLTSQDVKTLSGMLRSLESSAQFKEK